MKLAIVAAIGCGLLCAQADPLLWWLDGIAQKQLDQREAAIAAIHTVAHADRRKAFVLAKIEEILGGLPKERTPLKSRVTGTLNARRYQIEKVIFESLPGFAVTGNVYRPNAPGRYPAVLVPAGHTQEGKPEMQWLAANLAMQGYVVLAYDPIGQGEREQTYLPELGRALSGGGGNEHIELGARSMAIGQSVARYFIHDGIRALDYLRTRPDVDPERIGVTGCSGGGAITTYLGALDKRVKAAASGCHINSFRTLFTGPTPDSEMSLPRLLSSGLDWADFFELQAPLPWLLLATAEDYFTPSGAKPVYEEVRRWYQFYGAEDKLRYFVGPGPHGTPKESREEIYRWMKRWLGGTGEPYDQPVRLYTHLDLRVTKSGNVAGELGSRKLHQVIRDEFIHLRHPLPTNELKTELRRLGIPASGKPPQVTTLERINGPNYRLEYLTWESEPGVPIHGKLYLPLTPGRKPAVMMVEEKRLPVPLYVQRSQSTTALAEAMVAQDRIVLEVDPRDSPAAIDGRPFLSNWLTNERTDLVGLNLPALRARDVLVAIDLLTARPDVDPANIRGYARGTKGIWLLLAAACDPRLKKIWLDRTPSSLAAALDGPLASHLFEALIPGFVLHWDVPQLKELAGSAKILHTDPANWMNEVLPLGPGYRYRTVAEGDGPSLAEFLR